jgi:heme-degrading monooxygenase HmoA
MSAAVAGVFPPDEPTRALLAQVPGARQHPGMVTVLESPHAPGPEQAGALSLVYATFSAAVDAQRGYRRFAEIWPHLLEAPGFIRWIAMADGVHGYALGMWRSADDARAFARSDIHRQMVHEQITDPFERSQFAGIWTAHAVGRRMLYCDGCAAATAAPADRCPNCAKPLHDPFGG